MIVFNNRTDCDYFGRAQLGKMEAEFFSIGMKIIVESVFGWVQYYFCFNHKYIIRGGVEVCKYLLTEII